MPKYGIHGIVLNRAIDRLQARGTAPAVDAAGNLSAHRDLAALGAVGPDIFFWAPDYEIVKQLRKVQDRIVAAIDAYNLIMEPIHRIEDAARSAAVDLVDRLPPPLVAPVKVLIEQIQGISNTYRSAVSAVLATELIGIGNFIADAGKLPTRTSHFFSLFAPPLQTHLDHGGPHNVQDWYWFDMLHYRRTGRFASNLVTQAGSLHSPEKENALAYAYGYLSHIAADVVGHAFVNSVVGAPYRINVQRHVTVENFMDAWAYDAFYNGASASKDILIHLPLPATMPDEIVGILDRAFRATYFDLAPTRLGTPGFLTQDQIAAAYRTFYEVLQVIGKTGVARPEEPFPGANDLLSEIMSGLMGTLAPPPAPPEGAPPCAWEEILSLAATERSRDCYVGFFDRTEDWAQYIQEQFLWTFETVDDLVALIQATLPSMPLNVVLALLYGVRLLLYGSFRSARNVLAVYGFVTPEPDELGNNVAASLATTFLGCGSAPGGYPRRRDNAVSHLVCPSSSPESPVTRPDVLPPAPVMDPVALVEDQTFLRESLRMYADAANPGTTRNLAAESLRIGSACDLTRWMIETSADPHASGQDRNLLYANWNLDSDRGYGYRTWYGRGTAGGTQIVGEEYTD